MEETFKIPSIPTEESKPTETSTSSFSTSSSESTTHAPFLKPELPPADTTPMIRHKNLQYTIPESSSIPSVEYTIEVLRNGTIIDYIALSNRPYTVFGRSPDSDIVLEYPTISRYHAIIQYKSEFEHGQPPGLYLYDCGSTHGTFINKKRLEPKIYVRIKIGYIIKFGQSTRLYILQGDAAAEADSIDSSTGDDLTHEQMKKFHAKRAQMLAAVRAKRENAVNETNANNSTEMDWGMGPEMEEAAATGSDTSAADVTAVIQRQEEPVQNEEEIKKRVAADDLKNRLEYQKAKNDQSVLKEIMSRVDEPAHDDDPDNPKEPFYLKDPKRALTTFFEREGAELVYDVEDHQFGSYRCTIKLPIVDDYGRSIQAECEQKHCKRKEIIQQCIIEACRILDEHGVLREGTSASSLNTPRVQQIKRQLLEENDFYEEDEDTFYDRTGDLEKKRLKRMEWSGHLNTDKQIETFDSLCAKLKKLYNEQSELEFKLDQAKQYEDNQNQNSNKTDKDVDELDLYIRQLKQGEKINMKVKWQWNKRLLELGNEERQYVKLLKVCKPKEFDISKWRQNIQDQAKQKLTTKPSFILPTPPLPPPPVQKPIIETKTEQMPPPPPPPLPPVSSESQPSQSTSKQDVVTNPVKTKPTTTTRRKAEHASKNSKDQYDDADHYSDDKFSSWMPPENEQTGDGRTALNEKYGY